MWAIFVPSLGNSRLLASPTIMKATSTSRHNYSFGRWVQRSFVKFHLIATIWAPKLLNLSQEISSLGMFRNKRAEGFTMLLLCNKHNWAFVNAILQILQHQMPFMSLKPGRSRDTVDMLISHYSGISTALTSNKTSHQHPYRHQNLSLLATSPLMSNWELNFFRCTICQVKDAEFHRHENWPYFDLTIEISATNRTTYLDYITRRMAHSLLSRCWLLRGISLSTNVCSPGKSTHSQKQRPYCKLHRYNDR